MKVQYNNNHIMFNYTIDEVQYVMEGIHQTINNPKTNKSVRDELWEILLDSKIGLLVPRKRGTQYYGGLDEDQMSYLNIYLDTELKFSIGNDFDHSNKCDRAAYYHQLDGNNYQFI